MIKQRLVKRVTTIDKFKSNFPRRFKFDMLSFFAACPFSKEELLVKDRHLEVKAWRQVGMMWAACEFDSTTRAAKYFNKNHATVIHSLNIGIKAMNGYDDLIRNMIFDVSDYEESVNINPKYDDMNEVKMLIKNEKYIYELLK